LISIGFAKSRTEATLWANVYANPGQFTANWGITQKPGKHHNVPSAWIPVSSRKEFGNSRRW